jgi:hypothetical protein
VLLVVRAGSTKKPQIERALSVFDASRMVGLVLNASGSTQVGYSPYRVDAAAPVA